MNRAITYTGIAVLAAALLLAGTTWGRQDTAGTTWNGVPKPHTATGVS